MQLQREMHISFKEAWIYLGENNRDSNGSFGLIVRLV
jgi:hypothetical protein